MNIEQNKAVVRRFNKEVIEGQNIAIMDELFHPGFINRTARPGYDPGPEGMKAFLQVLWQAFSNIYVEIPDQVAEKDKVTTRKIIHGTHTGTFMNLAPTHKKVELHIIDIVRLSEGKYIEHWSVIDLQRVLAEINGE